MTRDEALKILRDAPADDKTSKINKALTRKQVVEIVTVAVVAKQDGELLNDVLVKRIHQVCQDRLRPDVWMR